MQVVVLHKEVGVGLGFSVAGGVDQNKPVIVRKHHLSSDKYLNALFSVLLFVSKMSSS